jgi:regulator of protease activity HflC (stomatin/prohibitin superfamily)
MAGEFEICVAVVFGLAMLIAFSYALASIRKIKAWEAGIKLIMGKYKAILTQGWHFVPAGIGEVIKVDLRTQTWDVPKQEVITKDNAPVVVDAVIYAKVVDPKKAVLEVQDYRVATVNFGMTTLRSVIGEMELDEILYNRQAINAKLRDILDKETDKWGIKVSAVEIKEVDPSPQVKHAMEEQTSAERERRAAILRADGVKRSAILEAEGKKRAAILEAEGERMARILRAEGERQAIILKAQGEAQRLRILSLGSATLDPKALTVLSFDTLKTMANGKATKIIFPFEVTKLVEGASEYLGSARTVREHTPASIEELQRVIGTPDDVLGPIPKYQEIERDIKEGVKSASTGYKDIDADKLKLSKEEIEKLAKGEEIE